MFQGPGRLEKSFDFNLHNFILHLLIILTPAGFLSLLFFIFKRRRSEQCIKGFSDASFKSETFAFLSFFTLVPVGVFFIYSFSHEVKFNWAGPCFVSLTPFLISVFYGEENGVIKKIWKTSIPFFIFIYLFTLHFLSFGFPFLGYTASMWKYVGFESVAKQVLRIEDRVRSESGDSPIVVGMDSHYVPSLLGFYRARLAEHPVPHTVGRHLFGRESLAYRFWSEPPEIKNKDLILISRTKSDLEGSFVDDQILHGEPIIRIEAKARNSISGIYYVRIVRQYKTK